MAINDNDHTKDIARAAVIVAPVRSGGTFLAHCLSNHPQIFCDRGEPLHHMSIWTTVTTNRVRLLAALTNQSGYRVSMCRITYQQAFKEEVWNWIVQNQPKLIWLRRENLLRQAFSAYLNELVRLEGKLKHPVHTFKTPGPVRVEIEPEKLIDYARGLQVQNRRAEQAMKEIRSVYPLTYAEITGGEGIEADRLPDPAAERLCSYLDVDRVEMACELKKVNPLSLQQMIVNWIETRAAIRKTEFERYLEGA